MAKQELDVSIGITTKDRWDDLAVTLRRIAECGLGHLPVFIIDDGSETPCPYNVHAFGIRDLSLMRFERSMGLVQRRNELARLMTTRYYFSLDDDSYPLSAELCKAVEFADAQRNLLAVTFPVRNAQGGWQIESRESQPYRCKAFVGCGHIVRLSAFYALGGYRSELVHQGEESDLAARGLGRGLMCWHFPAFVIQHNASLAGRIWYRMDYYGARNTLLWNYSYVPTGMLPITQARSIASRIAMTILHRRVGHIRGVLAFLWTKRSRSPLTKMQYKEWRALPPY
jgi:hypothetical protein